MHGVPCASRCFGNDGLPFPALSCRALPALQGNAGLPDDYAAQLLQQLPQLEVCGSMQRAQVRTCLLASSAGRGGREGTGRGQPPGPITTARRPRRDRTAAGAHAAATCPRSARLPILHLTLDTPLPCPWSWPCPWPGPTLPCPALPGGTGPGRGAGRWRRRWHRCAAAACDAGTRGPSSSWPAWPIPTTQCLFVPAWGVQLAASVQAATPPAAAASAGQLSLSAKSTRACACAHACMLACVHACMHVPGEAAAVRYCRPSALFPLRGLAACCTLALPHP